MSTLAGETPSELITHEDDLTHYFEAFVKPASGLLLGLEAEFLPVQRKTGEALSYFGVHGVEAILKFLGDKYGYEPVMDQGHVIALKREDRFISLEPGGQIELSASPVKNAFETEDQIQSFLAEIHDAQQQFPDFGLLAFGFQPFSKLEDIDWVPKTRYGIMKEFLAARGTQSHEMMKRTATVQLNLDYLDEADAMDKLKTSLGITSIVTAIFSNSSFSEGEPNGFATKRLDVWNHTDPARSGLIVEFTKPGLKFSDYLQYILQMPMIFILRGGQWIPMQGKTFRDFIREGHKGAHATVGDFELHLSTAFPEVRIKQFLEVRGIDGQNPSMIPAVAAFWKGILYNTEARDQAWALVADLTDDERRALHHEVPRSGLQSQIRGKAILPLAEQLVDISCRSLAKQRPENAPFDECVYLERIREQIIRKQATPGEVVVDRWRGEWKQDKQKLIQYLSL